MAYSDLVGDLLGQTATYDTKYWRVGLGQEWNDQWATYLFYYGYKLDDATAADKFGESPKEFGAGIRYKMNDYTTFGLNYIHADGDKDNEDNVVRFRTSITF